jgi:LysR family transcriptional regulator, low CO2-responsive transcriptional regulator
MDTDQLIAFQRVVREGTFSRAALTLDIGQPALSARIQALEGQLGGALFTRGRRVALTPLGTSFLPFVRRALETLEEGQRVAQAAQRGERGRVTVASLGSIAGGLLGPALAEFVRVHPQVECHARSGDHEFVLQQLWDGAVELGILVWPSGNASAHELEVLSVFDEPVVLAASPRHPLAQKRSIAQADLIELGRPLLKLRWWLTHEPRLLRLADSAGTSVEIAMEPARHLVRRGAATGFFPRTYIAEDLEREDLVALQVADLQPFQRKLALVVRARPEPLSPAAQDLVSAIRDQAAKLGLVVERRERKIRRR